MTHTEITVPPFDVKKRSTIKIYSWWSWHPLYPKWSKSCWGGNTIQEAMDARYRNGYDCLENYHNKIIRENLDGSLDEVFDSPCTKPDVWQRCIDLKMSSKNIENVQANCQTD